MYPLGFGVDNRLQAGDNGREKAISNAMRVVESNACLLPNYTYKGNLLHQFIVRQCDNLLKSKTIFRVHYDYPVKSAVRMPVIYLGITGNLVQSFSL